MKAYLILRSLFLVGVIFPVAASGQVVWDTTPSWVGSAGIDIFGDVNYANPSFGQTFTAPSGVNAMLSYTMWLQDRKNPDAVRFTANLVAWDGTKPTGPILYTSAPVSTSNNHGLDGYEQFTFSLPNVAVAPGQKYLAFLSSIGVSGSLVGSAYVGIVSGDALPGGQTYVNGLAITTADLYVQPWSFIQPSTDLAFRATFAQIPEPGFALLLLMGLGIFRLKAHRSR
jgi:hypothetical protein